MVLIILKPSYIYIYTCLFLKNRLPGIRKASKKKEKKQEKKLPSDPLKGYFSLYKAIIGSFKELCKAMEGDEGPLKVLYRI